MKTNNQYTKAYKEVYEILKYVPKEDFDKIPKDFITMLEIKMDKSYVYEIKKGKEFSEQEIMSETKEILAVISMEYWLDKEKRKVVEEKLKNDIIDLENRKKEIYDAEDIFKNKREKREEISSSNYEITTNRNIPKDIMKFKEKGKLQKVIDKIKRIFKFFN